jgi:flagellar export protein FliJ
MKRFVFRLARLERLREIERREARAELALCLGAEEQARIARQAAHSRLEEAWGAALDGPAASDGRSLRALADWREGLYRALGASDEALDRAAGKTREALDRHTEAARRHRVIERLHETKRERWLEEERLEEGKFLDEIHQLRLARERGGGAEAPTCEG